MPEASRWWCGICKAFVPEDSVHDGHEHSKYMMWMWEFPLRAIEQLKAEGAAEEREACAVMCEAIGQEEERGDNPWLGSVLGAFWKHAARNIRARGQQPKETTDE